MILDKYKLRKEQGTLSLKRVGYDVILTRDGDGVPDKKITSTYVSDKLKELAKSKSESIVYYENMISDYEEAEIDIKKLEAILSFIDPDAQ